MPLRLQAARVYADVVRGRHGQRQQMQQDMLYVLLGLVVMSYAGLCPFEGTKEQEQLPSPLTHHSLIPSHTSTDTQQAMITLRRPPPRVQQQHRLVSVSSRCWNSSSSSSRVPPPCVRRRPLQAASALPTYSPPTLHRLLLLQPCKRSFSQST